MTTDTVEPVGTIPGVGMGAVVSQVAVVIVGVIRRRLIVRVEYFSGTVQISVST